MSASIHLDRPQPHFTNLDILTGKVQVHLPSETTIGAIQVKLEGESRTRLSGPRPGYPDYSDKKRTELEVHKVSLYAISYCGIQLTSPDIVQSRLGLPDPNRAAAWLAGYGIHLRDWDVRVSV